MTIYRITHDNSRKIACQAVMQAPEGHEVDVREAKRTESQNALLWPLLDCFAAQLQWPVNGKMTQLTSDEWKDVLSSAFRKETARLAMGLDGGVVMLGSRTSRFTKPQFSEFIDFILYVAADRGVNLNRERVEA